jgi:hypothetical protein
MEDHSRSAPRYPPDPVCSGLFLYRSIRVPFDETHHKVVCEVWLTAYTIGLPSSFQQHAKNLLLRFKAHLCISAFLPGGLKKLQKYLEKVENLESFCLLSSNQIIKENCIVVQLWTIIFDFKSIILSKKKLELYFPLKPLCIYNLFIRKKKK